MILIRRARQVMLHHPTVTVILTLLLCQLTVVQPIVGQGGASEKPQLYWKSPPIVTPKALPF